jgi:hypothetical protein
MIKQLLYKWFGLESPTCLTCEVLRSQLDESNIERRDLLTRLLERDRPESVSPAKEQELQPIRPQFTPWRVRQQMLEAEDRKQAQLLRDKQKEMADARKPGIEELEKELEIPQEGTTNG